MAIRIALTDIESLKKLPGHHMNMAVHHECVSMERRELADARSNRHQREKQRPAIIDFALTCGSDLREYRSSGLELPDRERPVSVVSKGIVLTNKAH